MIAELAAFNAAYGVLKEFSPDWQRQRLGRLLWPDRSDD